MKRIAFGLTLAAACCLTVARTGLRPALPCAEAFAAADRPAVPMCEPWDAKYTGQDAIGRHVIALWSFDAGEETEDVSGGGHDLALENANIHAAGRFDSATSAHPPIPPRTGGSHPRLAGPD